MAAFENTRRGLERRNFRILHGAPHPQQWLVRADGYSLVDFDRCGCGDAKLDIATFVAEVDFENLKSFDVTHINEAFVGGFESVGGSLDLARFGLYRTHKHVAKALRLPRSVRVDGTGKAAALINHVRSKFTTMCGTTTVRTWVLVKEWKQWASVLAVLTIAKMEGLVVSVCEYLQCCL
jgi:hypothetical protein